MRACTWVEDVRLMDERRDTVDGVGESPHSSRGDRPTSPNSASLATLQTRHEA